MFGSRKIHFLTSHVRRLILGQKLLTLLLLNALAFCGPSLSVPLCDDSEIEEFFHSDEYQAMFSFYASVKRGNIALNYSSSEEENLMEFDLKYGDILPENKSLYLRRHPPRLCHKPARINFYLDVLSLDSIDEISMTYTLDVWLSMGWFDDRLRYPRSVFDYRILDPMWVKYVWIPDVIFKNARQVTFHELITPNNYLALLKNKAIMYITKLTLTLTCPMNLESYPHDVQMCNMEMESMTYQTQDLVFSWDAKESMSVMTTETPQFTLIHYKVEDCTNAYLSGSFPCVRAQFYLKRRIGYHVINTFLPSSFIVMLSWITFWIKPDEFGTRFTLGVTILLTLATINKQTQESLPQVSYIKAVDIWMITCHLSVIGAILEFAVINYLYGEYAIEESATQNNFPPLRSRNVTIDHRIQKFCHRIDEFSRFLFPSAFFFFSLWYWNAYVFHR